MVRAPCPPMEWPMMLWRATSAGSSKLISPGSSGGTPGELLNAIAAGDAARFQAVPGIGKRIAERVIVELREKVGERGDGQGIVVTRTDDPRALARQGLLGLGFTPQEADRLLADATGDTAEALIEHALRAKAAA